MAREIAIKVAYVSEMRGCDVEEALRDPMVTEEVTPPAYAVRLLSHMERYAGSLDDYIRAKVEKWEFHRIAVLDRLILRLGMVELLYFPDVPPKVSINEAIEIAKTYSTSRSGRFVNGILDAVYNDLINGRIRSGGGDGPGS